MFAAGAKLTEKVDVWALACVVAECWGAPPPYPECDNLQQIVAKLLVEKQPPAVPPCPPAVAATLRQAFGFEPASRPSAAQMLLAYS